MSHRYGSSAKLATAEEEGEEEEEAKGVEDEGREAPLRHLPGGILSASASAPQL